MARLQALADTARHCVSSSAMADHPLPKPDDASLHEAALRYLARYAASRVGVTRVLDRRVARWAREAAGVEPEQVLELRAAVRRVVDRLEKSGLINDALYAASRARSLTKAGRSRRAVAAHLGARGIGGAVAAEALPQSEEDELAACIILVRRRRLGPFAAEGREVDRMKALGVLARAGFAQSVAQRALDMDIEEAEERVIRLRQD